MQMYIKEPAVTKRHSIAEARSSLPSLVREAEAGRAIELTRRGEPVAVLIGRRQYERLVSKSRGFSEVYREFTNQTDLAALAIDPEEVFAGSRNKARGRAVDL